MFSAPDIAVILVIVLFVFGPKKLPEIGSSLGKGIRSLRKAAEEKPEEEAAKTVEPLEGKEVKPKELEFKSSSAEEVKVQEAQAESTKAAGDK